MTNNPDYPLYGQRPKHRDDTVIGTLGVILLFVIGIIFVAAH